MSEIENNVTGIKAFRVEDQESPESLTFIDPIESRIFKLEETIALLLKENAATRAKLIVLESAQEQDLNRICLDIAYDRQRIAKLELAETAPGKTQKDAGEVLCALVTANGGKMPAKDARQKMHMPADLFSKLLRTMNDCIELRPSKLDRRKKIIILK